ncbi:Carcinoembryonic antigen-related cell adhesion molecule 1 [Amphibalanus amphitrite]|uniref:Carcinoembryonic antigen-related cell adhesion molecule 1 n=1 Tax=Amphibalanus amphitrite TaxID=1232801 RepID=A0A6A4X9Y4_AMPAM|nr:Carcinoembryonic antigen-related cell adhesion molecule 1 [Amphibalanus amphitrite]
MYGSNQNCMFMGVFKATRCSVLFPVTVGQISRRPTAVHEQRVAVALDGLPHTIDAEEGTDVRIPCPQFREIQHPRGIRLVLWFRENETNPITSGRYRCRVDAEDDPTEVSWVQLTVHDTPKAILSGPSSELVEGDDAHFSCFVRAQPPAQFTFWLHNDRQLVSSDRIVAGPQLLIIKNLTPNDTGRYACFANNTLGAGLSNTVNLELKCHSSVLQWTPTTGTDYGRLLCRATNSLGRQLEPCRVDLVPPERPDPVHNCTVSLSEAVISCTPGPDGGMANWYTLWLFGPDELVGNWTENQPHFISADVRHEDTESAVQVHLQPPTPASTASTASTVDDQAEVHTPAESEEGAEDAYQDLQDPDTALEETETLDEQR